MLQAPARSVKRNVRPNRWICWGFLGSRFTLWIEVSHEEQMKIELCLRTPRRSCYNPGLWAQRQEAGIIRDNERAMRDQEVLRANKELAAYFKGQRIEREARAALKIIKAFVRGREELDPKSRPALPVPVPQNLRRSPLNHAGV
jgi:hypothetical protein